MLEDGFYWINDTNRYGWEVVKVKSNRYVFYTGISEPDLLESLLTRFDKMEFIITKEPL